MSIYLQKQQWKFGLLILAGLIGFSSLYFTNTLVKKLAVEERKKMILWAEAMREIADLEKEIADFSFLLRVIQFNETVPVIIVDNEGYIVDHRNLSPTRSNNIEFVKRQLELMKKKNEPIEILLYDDVIQYVYYNDSRILVWLFYYPYVQLLVIILFLGIAYYAFHTSRKAEQNHVWLGMSKETAHQLGTPISSLLGWLELMRERNLDRSITDELEKDVTRLEKVTARFSKIGAKPALEKVDIVEVINGVLSYLRTRSPKTTIFETNFSSFEKVVVPLNAQLFDWVIENIIKNSLDSMDGKGKIAVTLTDHGKNIHIDISDTGRGIPRNRHNTIFKPGYTTRKFGWGLGLSLSKRIIEEYHGGRIFVLQSALNDGTTIRIVLKKKVRIKK